MEASYNEPIHLEGINLSEATLPNINFSRTHLEQAWLNDTRMSGANLVSAHLDAAILDDAELFNANLEEAQLAGSSMHRVKLRDANITAANFTDSSLHHANLEPTDGEDAWRLADRSTEGVSEAPIAWKFKFPQGFFCRRKNGVEEHSSA